MSTNQTQVESRGRPPFPRQTSEWWFGCVNSNLAQRALSSSLKELRPRELADSLAGTQQTAASDDWSFLAGLDENKRILGTHISDQKPPTDMVVAAPNTHEADRPQEHSNSVEPDHPVDQPSFVSPPTITRRSSTVNGFRIGLFDSHSSSSAASFSSFKPAISSSAQIYPLIILAWSLTTCLQLLLTRRPSCVAW